MSMSHVAILAPWVKVSILQDAPAIGLWLRHFERKVCGTCLGEFLASSSSLGLCFGGGPTVGRLATRTTSPSHQIGTPIFLRFSPSATVAVCNAVCRCSLAPTRSGTLS